MAGKARGRARERRLVSTRVARHVPNLPPRSIASVRRPSPLLSPRQGDVLKLVDDIAALQPSLFLGVPRVFDRIYTRIMSQVGSRRRDAGDGETCSARRAESDGLWVRGARRRHRAGLGRGGRTGTQAWQAPSVELNRGAARRACR